MATFTKLPSGNWRGQVRRKGRYAAETFRRKKDAESWALEIERRFDGNERSRLLRLAEETFERHLVLRDQTRLAHESLDRLRADQLRLTRIIALLEARPEGETLH